jgi:hypothetical protein
MFKTFFSRAAALLLLAGISATADAGMKIIGRRAFLRNEKDAVLKVIVQADKNDLPSMEIVGSVADRPIENIKTPPLAKGAKKEFLIPVETRLTVGKYPIELTLRGNGSDQQKVTDQMLISPRLPDQMPVLIWGMGTYHHQDLQEEGFTHAISEYWKSRKFENYPYLDEMLFDGFRGLDSRANARKLLKEKPISLRVMRNGKPNPKKSLNAADPEMQDRAGKMAKERAAVLRDYPVIEGAIINSELRDSTELSFDPRSKAAFQKFAGYPIPLEAEEKAGISYTSLRKFPLSRVIPDNDPILTFYKWFWKDGDGWNEMNSRMVREFKQEMKRPVWTFHDPAVRVPPVWGSGGQVDCISHWVYATPDPINIGAVTSELQAMGKGNPNQQIMNMTQIIVYRSAVAPAGMKVANEPAWVKEFPKAPYISIAPDEMSIAVWTQISRHVQGIMFHGIDSLMANKRTKRSWSSYRLTNPGAGESLKAILVNIVRPFGPVLKRVPERKNEVALLESFTAAMFARRSTWGSVGWPFQAHLALLWANLAPSVIYDETILRDGLDGVKVLILPGCDVLTEKVYHAIADFQRKGGIVVGDRFLVPAITPDLTMEDYTRIDDPVKDKAELQKIGLKLRRQLAPFYQPYVSASNPDLVTWVRSSGDADYLFTVNDKRTFGDYFGPYKKVMEKSVDNSGTIQVRRAGTGAVYELGTGSEVPFEVKDGKTVIKAAYDAKHIGRLFLLLPEKIGAVRLKMASSAEKGKTVGLDIRLEYASGKTVSSIHPIRIEVRDAAGKLTDDSTYAALENGICRWNIAVPLNAAAGDWKVTATDLASGKKAEKILTVR